MSQKTPPYDGDKENQNCDPNSRRHRVWDDSDTAAQAREHNKRAKIAKRVKKDFDRMKKVHGDRLGATRAFGQSNEIIFREADKNGELPRKPKSRDFAEENPMRNNTGSKKTGKKA